MGEEQTSVFEKRLATVLGGYVSDDGRVNYEALSSRDETAKYVESLADFRVDGLKSRNEQLAFWINAYNMLTVYAVIKAIEEDPQFVGRGLNSFRRKLRFFQLNKYTVGGESYSLLKIEKEILRKRLKEPRVHFALVCGAESCPPLKRGLYSSDNLEAELDAAARIFVNSSDGSRLDKAGLSIRLSKIFAWYKDDFGGTDEALLDFVGKYHDEGEFIIQNKERLKIHYLPYNWSIKRGSDRKY